MSEKYVVTPRLRFVEREILEPIGDGVAARRKVRILQQWWERIYVSSAGAVDMSGGEWRDVPLEDV